MTKINPFDSNYNSQIGQTTGVNAPQRVGEQNPQTTKPEDGAKKPGTVDEDTLVDLSTMVDDTEGFDGTNFGANDGNDPNLQADGIEGGAGAQGKSASDGNNNDRDDEIHKNFFNRNVSN